MRMYHITCLFVVNIVEGITCIPGKYQANQLEVRGTGLATHLDVCIGSEIV